MDGINSRMGRGRSMDTLASAPEWNAKEIDILRASFATQPIDELRARLPGRGVNAIKIRAAVMGLNRKRGWTKEDIQRLESMRKAGHAPEAVARALGRSLSAISQKCRCLDMAAELRRYILERQEARK